MRPQPTGQIELRRFSMKPVEPELESFPLRLYEGLEGDIPEYRRLSAQLEGKRGA